MKPSLGLGYLGRQAGSQRSGKPHVSMAEWKRKRAEEERKKSQPPESRAPFLEQEFSRRDAIRITLGTLAGVTAAAALGVAGKKVWTVMDERAEIREKEEKEAERVAEILARITTEHDLPASNEVFRGARHVIVYVELPVLDPYDYEGSVDQGDKILTYLTTLLRSEGFGILRIVIEENPRRQQSYPLPETPVAMEQTSEALWRLRQEGHPYLGQGTTDEGRMRTVLQIADAESTPSATDGSSPLRNVSVFAGYGSLAIPREYDSLHFGGYASRVWNQERSDRPVGVYTFECKDRDILPPPPQEPSLPIREDLYEQPSVPSESLAER